MKKTVTMKRTTGKGKVANGDHPVSTDGPTRGGMTQLAVNSALPILTFACA